MTTTIIILSILTFFFAISFIAVCTRVLDKQEQVHRLNRLYKDLSLENEKEISENGKLSIECMHYKSEVERLTQVSVSQALLIKKQEDFLKDSRPEYTLDVFGTTAFIHRRSGDVYCVVKGFDSDDAEYNLNCATELLDCLKEKN